MPTDPVATAWPQVSPPAESRPPGATLDLPQHGHQVMRIFGKNTLWLLLDRAGLKVGAMLAGLVLVGYLGPTNLGVYSTAIAMGAILNALTDFGVTRYAARVVAAYPQEGPGILALSLTTTLLASLIEVAAIAIAFHTGHWYVTCMCLGFIFTNLEGTSYICTMLLSAELRSRAVLPGSILSTAGVLATIGLVLRFRWSVLGLLTGMAVKSLIVLLFRLWQVRKYWPRSWACFLPERFLQLMRRSRHFFSYTLTQLGYEKVAIISFGLVATQESVGLLSAALILAGIFPSFTYAASDALLPVMTRLFEAGRSADLLEMRSRLLNLLLVLCVPVGIVLVVFAPEICRLLGSKYVASAPVLRITATRSLFSVLDNFLGQSGLTAIARVRERRNAQALGLAVCAVLTIAAGAVWGPIGAAFATLAADAVILAAYFRVYVRVGMPLECPAAWSSGIAGLAMACVALSASHLFWPARAVAATAAYFVVFAIIARGRLLETAHTFKQSFISS